MKQYLMEYMGWTDEPEPEGSQDWLSMEDTDYTPFWSAYTILPVLIRPAELYVIGRGIPESEK